MGARDDLIANSLSRLGEKGATTIAIFDTCYSGGMVGGTQDLNIVNNIAVLAACQEDEDAYGDGCYSVFTTYLIEGISGAGFADADFDGFISANEWYDYALNGVIFNVQISRYFSNLDTDHDIPLFSGGFASYDQDSQYPSMLDGEQKGPPVVTPEPETFLLFLLGASYFWVKRFRKINV